MKLASPRGPGTREKRQNAQSAFYGDIGALIRELGSDASGQRVRTFSQTADDDVVAAIRMLQLVKNSALVVHGPRGCLYAADITAENPYCSTDLSEKDSIMGGERKLRTAIIRMHEIYAPERIFIVATPVVAINNDDITSVAKEMSAELGTSVVPVYTDGFKSKNSLTGLDYAEHALLGMIKEPDDKTHDVNLVSLGDVRRNAALAGSLGAIGLSARILELGPATPISELAGARCSVALVPERAEYLLGEISAAFGFPLLSPAPPVGSISTSRWLTEIGEALGAVYAASALASSERDRVSNAADRTALKGITCYISLPPSLALGYSRLVRELGGDVAGVSFDSADTSGLPFIRELASEFPSLIVHVSNSQSFELYNILKKISPDLYIANPNTIMPAVRLGIASLCQSGAFWGFDGVSRFQRAAKRAVKYRGLAARLAENTRESYRERWYGRNPGWYIKQEGKY
jgi:nitrogenase molybdenum-iron protein alpha/beta subunit